MCEKQITVPDNAVLYCSERYIAPPPYMRTDFFFYVFVAAVY